MNKQFEEWYNTKIQHGFWTYQTPVKEFYELPFSMQWGVYLDFFDSVNLNIQIEADLFEMNDLKPNVWKYQYYIDIITDEVWFNTRTEAQKEAIKKAFEILEQ